MQLYARLRGHRPHRRGLLLVTLAGALVVLNGYELFESFGQVLLERVAGDTVAVGALAVVLLAWAALCLAPYEPTVHGPVGPILAGTALVFGGVGLGIVGLAAGSLPHDESRAPNGRFTAVTNQLFSMSPDAVWRVTIEQNGGLSARRWVVGCGQVDTDASVLWEGSQTLVLVAAGTEVARVSVDPRTGRPRGRMVVGPDAVAMVGGDTLWPC